MSGAAEEIAKQAQTDYLNYNKIKTFEDVGYFLESYVVSGGVVNKNITKNNQVDISETVFVLDDDVTYRPALSGYKLKSANTTYYVDLYKGDYWIDAVHPPGSAGQDYLTLATVTTDANGNVSSITDTAGVRGGFRLKSDYGLSGFMRPIFNVLDYGAKGDGATDDTTAIQTTLNQVKTAGSGVVVIPKGTYILTNILKIPSNTTFLMDEGTVLFRNAAINSMLMNDSDGTIGGYSANSNIHIVGGTIDCNKSAFGSECTPIGIGHAKNVSVRNVTIKNLANWHMIEFNAVQDGYIGNCHFHDYGPGGTEMVQIDFAYDAGFPWWGPWDDTPCDNITIENCVFENGTDGIGSHSEAPTGVFHTNIRILNNTFRHFAGVAIKPLKYSHLLIEGNHIEDVFRGIYLQPAGEEVPVFRIKNNIMNTFKVDVQSRGIMVDNYSDGVISGNYVDGCGRHGIGVDNSNRIMVSENHVVNCGALAMWIYVSNDCLVSNNWLKGNGKDSSLGYSFDFALGHNINSSDFPSNDNIIIGNHIGIAWVPGYNERTTIINNEIDQPIDIPGTCVNIVSAPNRIGSTWAPENRTWSNFVFQNGWSNYGGDNPTAQYLKDINGRVHIRGTVKSGTTTFGTVMVGTLPVGYRPSATYSVGVIMSTSGGEVLGRISIHPDGTITYRGADTVVNWLQLNNISFVGEM